MLQLKYLAPLLAACSLLLLPLGAAAAVSDNPLVAPAASGSSTIFVGSLNKFSYGVRGGPIDGYTVTLTLPKQLKLVRSTMRYTKVGGKPTWKLGAMQSLQDGKSFFFFLKTTANARPGTVVKFKLDGEAVNASLSWDRQYHSVFKEKIKKTTR
jgi:hypothetical protein